MFTQRTLIPSVVATALQGFFATNSANGAYVQLTGTNWEYDTNAGVTFTLSGGTGQTSANPWQVTELYAYSDMTPITTHWRETTAPTANGDNYFLFSEDLVNGSGKDWRAYGWVINDDNGTEQAGASHPLAAHFHTGTLTQYSPFSTLLPQNTGGNGVFNMSVSNGTLTNGSTWYANNVKVHDYDNFTAQGQTMSNKDANPGATAFTVIETPIATPEPSTLILAACGAVGLFGYCRRRRS